MFRKLGWMGLAFDILQNICIFCGIHLSKILLDVRGDTQITSDLGMGGGYWGIPKTRQSYWKGIPISLGIWVRGYTNHCDTGTENVNIAAMQRFFRRDGTDVFGEEKSFLYGKSVFNQRFEGWWSFLRKSESDWWISFLKDLRGQGLLNDDDYIHMQCLKICFMPLLRAGLQRVAQHWNLHKIRPSRNEDSPAGRPDVLYFIPEADGKESRHCK